LETIAENIRIEAQNMVNVDTGRLRDSIEVSAPDKWTRDIGSDVDYAIWQEIRDFPVGEDVPYGDEHYSFKPYLRPALDKVVNGLYNINGGF